MANEGGVVTEVAETGTTLVVPVLSSSDPARYHSIIHHFRPKNYFR